MDMEVVRSALTVLSLTAYVGIVIWAYVPSRRVRFDRDALIPFSQHDDAVVCRRNGTVSSPPQARDL